MRFGVVISLQGVLKLAQKANAGLMKAARKIVTDKNLIKLAKKTAMAGLKVAMGALDAANGAPAARFSVFRDSKKM